MGTGIPIPNWLGGLILIGGFLNAFGVLPYYSAAGEEVNPSPEPAHCYELVDGQWDDICV